MIKKLRNRLIKYLTKNLLKALTEDDILTLTKEGYFYKKRKLSKEDLMHLKEQSQALRGSLLWKLMTNEVRYQAYMRMGDQAKTPDDIVFGKAMGYNLSLQEKLLKNLDLPL